MARGRKRARKVVEESSSSSESEFDWRQEVWRRGFQGPFGPWAAGYTVPTAWPAWGQYTGLQQHGGYGEQPAASSERQGRKRRRQGSPSADDWQEDADDDWQEAEGGGDNVPPWQRDRNSGGTRGAWPRRTGCKPPPIPDDDEGGSRGAWPRRTGCKPPPIPDDDEEIDLMMEMQTEYIEVPKKYIAKLIGKKGSQIRAIRDETGAHVDARDQTEDPCRVKLLGNPDAIAAARQRIFEIIELSKHKPGIVLEVPRAKIGKVIGIRGAQVHEIQTTTGAKVDVDKDVDPCKITIGGTDLQIAHAEKLVLTLAMEAADQESEYMDLPAAVSGAVLGVKGARLMELQAASGARIDVDRTRPATCRVRIAGSPDQINLAKQLVLLAAEAPRPPEATISATPGEVTVDSMGNVVETMDLPAGTPGKVIGRGGSTIQSIQGETGARIWVDCETCQARISGQAGAVEHARLLVQALVDEELSLAPQAAGAPEASPSLFAVGEPEDPAHTGGNLGGTWVVPPSLNPAPAAAPRVVSPPPWMAARRQEQLEATDPTAASTDAAWQGEWLVDQTEGLQAVEGDAGAWAAGAEWQQAEEAGQQPEEWAQPLEEWAQPPEEAAQQPAEAEAWGWAGEEAAAAEAAAAEAAGTGAEEAEEPAFPQGVQPQTAMQRAFALLAARRQAKAAEAPPAWDGGWV